MAVVLETDGRNPKACDRSMDPNWFLSMLGRQVAEAPLSTFLKEKGVSAVPRPTRGESTANVLLKSDGIELIFSEVDALDLPNPTLPEGAFVLSNITFYGAPRNSLKAFGSALPLGLKFGTTRGESIQRLGQISWSDDDVGSARWDKNGYCIFADFDESERLVGVAIQLPVA